MTGVTPRSHLGRRRRGVVIAAVVGLGTLVLAALLAGPPRDDVPLDPTSAGPSGLRGMVEVLEGIGADVTIALEPPDDTDTRVFVPVDVLPSARQDALRDWVRDGGTLVVAGTATHLHDLVPGAMPLAPAIGPVGRAPACRLPALAEVAEVVHSRWGTFEIPADAGAEACFAAEGVAWLVAVPEGRGTVVALGSAEPFVNARLDDADNAVLAAALLAPEPGDRLVVVPRPPVGEGDAALSDLVPDRAWHALALLLVAVLLAVVWRSRRLGGPVPEVLPPVVPSAELARSVSRLLERTGSRQEAVDLLRSDARTGAGRALGLSPSTAGAALVELAAERLLVPLDVARTALVDAPVRDDDQLVAVARAVRQINEASRHWPHRSSARLSTKRSTEKALHPSRDIESGASP